MAIFNFDVFFDPVPNTELQSRRLNPLGETSLETYLEKNDETHVDQMSLETNSAERQIAFFLP
jgi:hypothetical protein